MLHVVKTVKSHLSAFSGGFPQETAAVVLSHKSVPDSYQLCRSILLLATCFVQ